VDKELSDGEEEEDAFSAVSRPTGEINNNNNSLNNNNGKQDYHSKDKFAGSRRSFNKQQQHMMQRTSSGGSSSNLSGVGVRGDYSGGKGGAAGQRFQGVPMHGGTKPEGRGGMNNYQGNRREFGAGPRVRETAAVTGLARLGSNERPAMEGKQAYDAQSKRFNNNKYGQQPRDHEL